MESKKAVPEVRPERAIITQHRAMPCGTMRYSRKGTTFAKQKSPPVSDGL